MLKLFRFLPARWWSAGAWKRWTGYLRWRLETYGADFPDGKLHASALRRLARQWPSYQRWISQIDRLRQKRGPRP